MLQRSISQLVLLLPLMILVQNWYDLLQDITQLFMDAALYVKDQVDQFDVIIVDSSDPVGMNDETE